MSRLAAALLLVTGCEGLHPKAVGEACGDGTNDVIMRVAWCPEGLSCLRTDPAVESFKLRCAVPCDADGGCPGGCTCRGPFTPTCWAGDVLCAPPP